MHTGFDDGKYRHAPHRTEHRRHARVSCPAAVPWLPAMLLIVAATTSHAQSAATTTINHAATENTHAPVLTFENNTYTIFDDEREEHVFHRSGDGKFHAVNQSSGTLRASGDQHFEWSDAAGHQIRFNGSLRVKDECRPEPSTDISTPHTPTPHTPVETDNNPPGHEGDQEDDNEDEQCDTSETGDHAFLPASYQGTLIHLDARPRSCKSYFVEYYGTQRGMEIEAGLRRHAPYSAMEPTIRTFPVIDFMDEHTLYVLHSRDLGNRTFNSPAAPNALLDQLLNDGKEIKERFLDVLHRDGSLSASELGRTTTISTQQLRPITLQIVIRDGMASDAHWRQIAIAREQLQTLYGITLEVVVIP